MLAGQRIIWRLGGWDQLGTKSGHPGVDRKLRALNVGMLVTRKVS